MNFRIKQKRSQDFVPYLLNAPEVLKMHCLSVSCCLCRSFESEAKTSVSNTGDAGAEGLFPSLEFTTEK